MLILGGGGDEGCFQGEMASGRDTEVANRLTVT